MIVSVLAVCFLIFIAVVAFFGYKMVISRSTPPEEINTEKCSLCKNRFHKSELIVRQVGDYRLYFFCGDCIDSLYTDAKAKYN